MDAKELARRTLQVLDMQQEYFKFGKPNLLAESKAAEAKLRRACQEIIDPPPSHQPDLFGEARLAPSDRFADLERRMAEWHVRKFGDGPINGPRTFAKLIEEVGELAEAWNKADAEALAIEAADVVIVLFHFVRGADRSLTAALLAKAAVIEDRLKAAEATSHKG